ncbi:MAG: hypothetical protein EOP06_10310 [Proteobacteria bacterium]|nr:MAG: hypothetical protein EOP06_10310 [Pseudomonadota bacterium]
MKTIIVTAALSFLISTSAFASQLECHSRVGNSGSAENSLELHLSGAYFGGWMKDAVATVQFRNYDGSLKQETARAAQLEADQDYRPTTYRNHERFDLSNMTEVTRFEKFQPVDQCQIYVMLPQAAAKSGSFEAPVNFHCDQGGGKLILTCVSR